MKNLNNKPKIQEVLLHTRINQGLLTLQKEKKIKNIINNKINENYQKGLNIKKNNSYFLQNENNVGNSDSENNEVLNTTGDFIANDSDFNTNFNIRKENKLECENSKKLPLVSLKSEIENENSNNSSFISKHSNNISHYNLDILTKKSIYLKDTLGKEPNYQNKTFCNEKIVINKNNKTKSKDNFISNIYNNINKKNIESDNNKINIDLENSKENYVYFKNVTEKNKNKNKISSYNDNITKNKIDASNNFKYPIYSKNVYYQELETENEYLNKNNCDISNILSNSFISNIRNKKEDVENKLNESCINEKNVHFEKNPQLIYNKIDNTRNRNKINPNNYEKSKTFQNPKNLCDLENDNNNNIRKNKQYFVSQEKIFNLAKNYNHDISEFNKNQNKNVFKRNDDTVITCSKTENFKDLIEDSNKIVKKLKESNKIINNEKNPKNDILKKENGRKIIKSSNNITNLSLDTKIIPQIIKYNTIIPETNRNLNNILTENNFKIEDYKINFENKSDFYLNNANKKIKLEVLKKVLWNYGLKDIFQNLNRIKSNEEKIIKIQCIWKGYFLRRIIKDCMENFDIEEIFFEKIMMFNEKKLLEIKNEFFQNFKTLTKNNNWIKNKNEKNKIILSNLLIHIDEKNKIRKCSILKKYLLKYYHTSKEIYENEIIKNNKIDCFTNIIENILFDLIKNTFFYKFLRFSEKNFIDYRLKILFTKKFEQKKFYNLKECFVLMKKKLNELKNKEKFIISLNIFIFSFTKIIKTIFYKKLKTYKNYEYMKKSKNSVFKKLFENKNLLFMKIFFFKWKGSVIKIKKINLKLKKLIFKKNLIENFINFRNNKCNYLESNIFCCENNLEKYIFTNKIIDLMFQDKTLKYFLLKWFRNSSIVQKNKNEEINTNNLLNNLQKIISNKNKLIISNGFYKIFCFQNKSSQNKEKDDNNFLLGEKNPKKSPLYENVNTKNSNSTVNEKNSFNSIITNQNFENLNSSESYIIDELNNDKIKKKYSNTENLHNETGINFYIELDAKLESFVGKIDLYYNMVKKIYFISLIRNLKLKVFNHYAYIISRNIRKNIIKNKNINLFTFQNNCNLNEENNFLNIPIKNKENTLPDTNNLKKSSEKIRNLLIKNLFYSLKENKTTLCHKKNKLSHVFRSSKIINEFTNSSKLNEDISNNLNKNNHIYSEIKINKFDHPFKTEIINDFLKTKKFGNNLENKTNEYIETDDEIKNALVLQNFWKNHNIQ